MSDVGEWAPVIVTVYNRPEHFRSCLDALLANEGASKTELYISSDGPRSSQDEDAVSHVRKIASEVRGFKTVKVFAPEDNTGGKIQEQVIEHVRAEHDSYIFLEDDIYAGPGFLKFINQGLRDFANNRDIEAICGYLYPDFPAQGVEQIYLQCFTAWGYGTWSSRESFNSGPKESAHRVFDNRRVFSAVNTTLPHTVRLNRQVLRGTLVAQDVNVCNRLFLSGKHCVFPPVSLTKNMGFDGSGEHCRADLVYARQALGSATPRIDPSKPVGADERSRRFLFHHFGGYVFSSLNELLYLEHRAPEGAAKKAMSWVNDAVWSVVLGSYGVYRRFRDTMISRFQKSPT